jgi:uncharacterized protein (DUF488 family)
VDSERRLLTVGHGLSDFADFVANLERHGVTTVIDVRSYPVSKRAPAYDRGRLEVALRSRGVTYVWAGDALGGKPPADLLTAAGVPDYERMAQRPKTRAALDRLAERVIEERLALLCSESRPEECHRLRMLEPELARRGVVVDHILSDGSLMMKPTLFA